VVRIFAGSVAKPFQMEARATLILDTASLSQIFMLRREAAGHAVLDFKLCIAFVWMWSRMRNGSSVRVACACDLGMYGLKNKPLRGCLNRSQGTSTLTCSGTYGTVAIRRHRYRRVPSPPQVAGIAMGGVLLIYMPCCLPCAVAVPFFAV
jgi:hypothetical protein